MIKGIGRINRAINNKLSYMYKKEFVKKMPLIDLNLTNNKRVNISLFSLCDAWNIPVQLLSILSFVKNVGVPYKWTIISDGTYTEEQCNYFNRYDFIEVRDWKEVVSKEYINFINNNNCWQYKKFFSYASVDISKPTILLDSDILFFEKFKYYFDLLENKNWYFTDLSPFFEDGFVYESEVSYINSGFLILNNKPDWSKGIEYILTRPENLKVHHFTEQTAIWIVVKENKMSYLDPRLFYTELADHFTLNNTIDHNKIALRHFPGPIRFRFWLAAKEFNYFC